MSAEHSAERAASAGRKEPYNTDFLKRVEQYYNCVSKKDASYRVVDATKTIDEITKEVCTILWKIRV